jgi:hypothetical protein
MTDQRYNATENDQNNGLIIIVIILEIVLEDLFHQFSLLVDVSTCSSE